MSGLADCVGEALNFAIARSRVRKMASGSRMVLAFWPRAELRVDGKSEYAASLGRFGNDIADGFDGAWSSLPFALLSTRKKRIAPPQFAHSKWVLGSVYLLSSRIVSCTALSNTDSMRVAASLCPFNMSTHIPWVSSSLAFRAVRSSSS